MKQTEPVEGETYEQPCGCTDIYTGKFWTEYSFCEDHSPFTRRS